MSAGAHRMTIDATELTRAPILYKITCILDTNIKSLIMKAAVHSRPQAFGFPLSHLHLPHILS